VNIFMHIHENVRRPDTPRFAIRIVLCLLLCALTFVKFVVTASAKMHAHVPFVVPMVEI